MSASVESCLDALMESQRLTPIPLPKNPPLVFTYVPAKQTLLRKVRRYMPEEKQSRQRAHMLAVNGGPELQAAIRSIAYIESRSITTISRILLGLGLRAYAKLTSAITDGTSVEAAADSTAYEMIQRMAQAREDRQPHPEPLSLLADEQEKN